MAPAPAMISPPDWARSMLIRWPITGARAPVIGQRISIDRAQSGGEIIAGAGAIAVHFPDGPGGRGTPGRTARAGHCDAAGGDVVVRRRSLCGQRIEACIRVAVASAGVLIDDGHQSGEGGRGCRSPADQVEAAFEEYQVAILPGSRPCN